MQADFVIRRLSHAAPLLEDEQRAVRDLCENVNAFVKHRDIHGPKDCAGNTFVMLEGWAARYCLLPSGERRILGFLLPGDFCDLDLAVATPLDHAVASITDCAIARMSKARAEAVFQSTASLKRAWGHCVRLEHVYLRQWLTSAGRRSAREALAHLLCELSVRLEQVGLAADNAFRLPTSQLDLADALGMTPVHVNRVLRAMRNEGLITKRQGIQVMDWPAMRRIAGFHAQEVTSDDAHPIGVTREQAFA